MVDFPARHTFGITAIKIGRNSLLNFSILILKNDKWEINTSINMNMMMELKYLNELNNK